MAIKESQRLAWTKDRIAALKAPEIRQLRD
jgi:hypothetical protein